MRRLPVFAALALASSLVLTGCTGWQKTDRCYLSMDRYRPLRDVFVETGSIQRVQQIMDEQQWATCEVNQFMYLLEKDLYLEDILIDDVRLAPRYEPPPDGPAGPEPASTP